MGLISSEPMQEIEEKCIPLECDLCDSCESVFAVPAYNMDGVLEEWVCVGLIQKPTDEKDIHDTINTIRICIEKPGGRVTSHEWTTWETSCVVTGLNMAITKDLEENQPTLERVEELIKLGYHDQNDQKAEDIKEKV